MKQFFSESYLKVCLGAPREQLELRWQGIEEYCKKESFDIYQLVRLYYGLKTADEFYQEFISIFNDLDISFIDENKRELSVLSGNILINLMKSSDLKNFIILSIICLSKYDIDVVLPEIIEKAYNCFCEISVKNREREYIYKSVNTKVFEDYANEFKSNPTANVVHFQKLESLCNVIASNMSLMVENQNEMQNEMQLYREDSNILSWLCGEWSDELDIQLTKKTYQKSVALLLAKELVDLVTVLPGPYAAKSFLKKMLDLCKLDTNTYTIVEMIDAIDNDRKRKFINSYSCIAGNPENTPILYSLKSALDTNTSEVWKHVVSNHMGVDICEVKNSILDWAELMYFECVLVKAECE